jgi:hypothetical protein
MSRFALVTPGTKRVSSARRAAPMIRRCRLSQIVDADVRAIPAGGPNGTDMFDVALCAAGIFARSPQRGTSRRRAEPPRTVAQLVALGDPAVSRNSFLIYPWRVLGLPWLHPPGHHFDGTGILTVEEHAAADIAARPTTPPPTTRQGG